MKRSFALALCLLLALVPFVSAEESDPCGVWYCTVVHASGRDFNPVDLGMDISLTVEPGGTLTFRGLIEGEDVAGQWTQLNGTIAATDSYGGLYAGRLEDGLLILTQGEGDLGLVMTFSRDPGTGTVLAETVPAAGEADFLGLWRVSTFSIAGTVADAADMGVSVRYAFTDGQVLETSDTGSGATERTYTTAFGDGVLTMLYEDTVTATVSLCADGTLLMVIGYGEGNSMTCLLVPDDAP